MEPQIGNRSDAITVLRAILDVALNENPYTPINYWIEDYECTLVECLEALLDALEREII